MRLLKRDNADGISFTKNLSDSELQTYKYAILSHTWGSDEEEVSHDDILNGIGTKKPGSGSHKIRFCIQQTRRDGLEYFWIDTCCINKKDTTELNSALISMFRWYSNAAKCYALLSDVSIATPIAGNDQILESWQDQFRNSRWFKRGWTLQELLAPKVLEFFSADGHNIGNKGSLGGIVSDITSIPISALHGQSLNNFTVRERLAWQKDRDTKEPEDIAYSLLGILNVSMPVLYGEGRAKAQARLQREVYADMQSNRLEHEQCLPTASRQTSQSYPDTHQIFPLSITQATNFGSLIDRLSQAASRLTTTSPGTNTPSFTRKKLAASCKEMSVLFSRLEGFREESVFDVALLMRCMQIYGQETVNIESTINSIDKTTLASEDIGNMQADQEDYQVEQLLDELETSKALLSLTLRMYDDKRQSAQLTHANMTKMASLLLHQSQQTVSTTQQSLDLGDAQVMRQSTYKGAGVVHPVGAMTVVHNQIKRRAPDYPDLLAHRQIAGKQVLRTRLWWTWFSSKIWDLAVVRAQAGWNIQLRVSNEVAWDAPILRCCMHGDIQGIRELIAVGQASLYDRQGDTTLLMLAVQWHQLDVCKYLLKNMGSLDTDELGKAFGSYYGSTDADAEKFYRLFIEGHGFDVDDVDRAPLYFSGWWAYCPSKECQEIVLRNMSLPWSTRPIEERFELAMRMTRTTPDAFLQLTGLIEYDSQLIGLRDSRSRSALHHVADCVAMNLATDRLPNAQAWAQLGTQLLQAGLNPHLITDDHDTPLMNCIQATANWGIIPHGKQWPHRFRNEQEALRIWTSMLERAGLAIENYLELENALLRTKDPIENTKLYRGVKLLEMGWSQNASQLTAKCTEILRTSVYALSRCPGTFEVGMQLPSQICWWPSPQESREDHWRYVKDVAIESGPIDMYTRTLIEPDPFVSLIEQAQDDAGPVALMIDQQARKLVFKPRSYSQSRPIRHREAAYLTMESSQSHKWFPDYHLCPHDSRYRSGCDTTFTCSVQNVRVANLRSCAESASLYDSANWHTSQAWQSRSFLTEIWRCQRGYQTSTRDAPALMHDRTPQCPQGCAQVDMNKMARLWRHAVGDEEGTGPWY